MMKLNNLIVLVLLFALLSACGGGGGGGGGDDPAPTPDLGTNPDANTGDTSEPGTGGTPDFTAGESAVNALFFLNGSPVSGDSKPLQIKVDTNSDNKLKVGFFESEVGGSGPDWQAAGWMAVTLIPQLLSEDPAKYDVSFSVAGNIDGPSAGGLMTVGLLAAIRGDTVNPQAGMTGTINPDGSIGPVGGIVHKIQGAADNGLTLVLAPEGNRRQQDMNTGELQDLADWGRQLGVEVRFVSNIFQAYELLTSASLPRPAPASGSPTLEGAAFTRLDSKAREWLAEFQSQRSDFANQASDVQAQLAGFVSEADDLAARAQEDVTQGSVAVGYARAWQAATWVSFGNLAADMLTSIQTNGVVTTLTNALNGAAASEGDLDSLISLLRAKTSSTVSDDVALIDAYRYVAVANGLVFLARSEITSLQSNADQLSQEQIVEKLITATLYYAFARHVQELGRDALVLYTDFGVTPAASQEVLVGLAEALRLASDANLNYFENVTIDGYAQQFGVRLEAMQGVFLRIDMDYLFAFATRAGQASLRSKMGADVDTGAYQLGNALATYTSSAMTTTKWYALDTQLDQNFNIVSVTREGALDNMFTFAEQRALEFIDVAGDDAPLPAIVSFDLARRDRQSTDKDTQISALQSYWDAAILAHAAGFLAGKLPK